MPVEISKARRLALHGIRTVLRENLADRLAIELADYNGVIECEAAAEDAYYMRKIPTVENFPRNHNVFSYIWADSDRRKSKRYSEGPADRRMYTEFDIAVVSVLRAQLDKPYGDVDNVPVDFHDRLQDRIEIYTGSKLWVVLQNICKDSAISHVEFLSDDTGLLYFGEDDEAMLYGVAYTSFTVHQYVSIPITP